MEEAEDFTGMEGEGKRYREIWEVGEDAAEFAELCDGRRTGEKKEWDCKRKHTTLLTFVELTFIAALQVYIYS